MKILDLFCGRGGWSKGFAKEGFECIGVDVVEVGYPFELLIADVRELSLEWIQHQIFDVIVGSPPCRDFSLMTNFGKTRWKEPPDPKVGLNLVYAFIKIICEIDPPFWIMENVPQLEKYLGLKPNCVVKMKTPRFIRALWGRFPGFLVPLIDQKKTVRQIHGKYRAWKRAEIPYQISQSLAHAIKQTMIVA